jgi:hypothetical protein
MVRFNYTEEFYRQLKRLAKRYRSLADDIDTLQHELMENPDAGVSLNSASQAFKPQEQNKANEMSASPLK